LSNKIAWIKNWLAVMRAPTLLAVLAPVMAGFLAGGGGLFTLRGLGFLAFAWAMHHFTFAHNTLLDVAYDAEKGPECHPLTSGAMPLATARTAVYGGLLLSATLGTVLALTGGGNPGASLAALLFFTTAGFAYNECSKVAPHAWALLALSFASLAPFAYFAVAPAADPLVILLAGYFFLTFWFGTWWEGNMKDIEFRGANALRDMGVHVKNKKLVIQKNHALCARAVKLVAVTLAAAGLAAQDNAFVAFFAGILVAVMVYFSWGLTRERTWDRERVVTEIGCEEVASLLLPIAVVAGWVEVLVLVVFGAAYTMGTAALTGGRMPEGTSRGF